jgi:S1-C subfamily serine protease
MLTNTSTPLDTAAADDSNAPAPRRDGSPIDTLLLAATRIGTFEHERPLTNASGFFFEREGRLFLVTSRHVVYDKPSNHYPNRLEIELHTNATDLSRSSSVSMLIYRDGKSQWRQGKDSGGDIDVALVEIDRSTLPADAVFHAFTPEHLHIAPAVVEVGSSALIVGFPLGFHDTVYHLPVVRHSVIASAFGIRFQGKGYFLTDARTHRGTSGAPVVMRDPEGAGKALPWKLLGVHSARLDMANRDLVKDESLGLNSAWYADILMTLTAD